MECHSSQESSGVATHRNDPSAVRIVGEFITLGNTLVPEINWIYRSVTIVTINVNKIRNENQSSHLFRTRIFMLSVAKSFPLLIRSDPEDPPSGSIVGFSSGGANIPGCEVFKIRAFGHQPSHS